MRILVVNWQDRRNPNAGGAEEHLHEIFGRIADHGHHVTFLTSGWPGGESRDRMGEIDVHRVGGRYTFGTVAPAYYRQVLAGQHWDVMVEALNKVPLFTPLWAHGPVVLLVHHLFGSTAFREASAAFAGMTWLLERPLPRVYRGVPVQAISRSTAEDLVARGLRPTDIEVVYPGVDLDFFHPSGTEPRFEEPVFLSLGRLRRYKRVDLGIRALAALRGEGIDARLIVAGRGPEGPVLAGLARRCGVGAAVEFEGFVPELRKRELLRRSWAHVFTSPKEGWGITNLEAAACGTPTIGSDSPGLRESVRDGETGILLPHGDLSALVGAMRALATSRGTTERLGSAAYDFAQGFSWDRAAQETLVHLREVTRTPAAAAAPYGIGDAE